MADDMLSWLRAQIEARLAIARTGLLDGSWYDKGDLDDYDHINLGDEWAAYVADNPPKEAIARCEAELALLDQVLPEIESAEGAINGEWNAYLDISGLLIRTLASGYRHRPGWSLSWSPDTTEGAGAE